jgi:VIT1/CCC1 family predicted Fe2+/Mn2+ transporter
MPGRPKHRESHVVSRLGWLRAAVLGANDGLLSTSSLIIGVATAHGSQSNVVIAGLSGLVAGAMSMAAGEFVSVSSQSDSEGADIERERRELADDPAAERAELRDIYVERGLTPELASAVAEQLMSKDALAAHTRDELGISEDTAARPVTAALTSAASFSLGAALPVLVAVIAPAAGLAIAVAVASVLLLALLGAAGARMGGSNVLKGAVRVTFWGILAMAVTAGVGALVG